MNDKEINLPGGGTVFEEDIKVFGGKKFTSIDSRLNRSKSSQDTHLFYVADNGHDVQSLKRTKTRGRERNVKVYVI